MVFWENTLLKLTQEVENLKEKQPWKKHIKELPPKEILRSVNVISAFLQETPNSYAP